MAKPANPQKGFPIQTSPSYPKPSRVVTTPNLSPLRKKTTKKK